MPYTGKGVLGSVEYVNKTTAPTLVSKKLNVSEQEKTDGLMAYPNATESKFDTNVILEVSLAVCKVGALEKGASPLPSYC